MRDDFLSTTWVAHHERTSGTLHHFFKALTDGFDRLQARQFAAPWRRRHASHS